VRAGLERSGVDAGDAELAARLAGGQPARARSLVVGGVDRAIRDAFVAAAVALDGRAGSALRQADGLTEAVKAAVAGVEVRQREEADALAEEIAKAGYPDRAASALTTRLSDRHKRQHRAARRQALREGIAALEAVYRDVLAGPDAPRRNLDRAPLAVTAAEAARGLDACRAAREALERNPNEALLVEHLLLDLPAAMH
jgi:DNA polymerase-3 subunit delta'